MSPAAKHRAPDPDKRRAILDAALELFVERGFHGTAVPAIAERAGVGAGTIYRYFDSKESLFNSLYQQWKQTLASKVVVAIDVGAEPREQFRQLLFSLYEFARQNPNGFNFLELHHHGSYLDEHSRAVEDRVLALITAFVTRLQEQKVLKGFDAMALMSMVYWGFVGLMRCSQEGRVELTDEVLAAVEQSLWQAVAA